MRLHSSITVCFLLAGAAASVAISGGATNHVLHAETDASCPSQWINGPKPGGFGFQISEAGFQGILFSSPSSANKIPGSDLFGPFPSLGIASYTLSPDPLSGVGTFKDSPSSPKKRAMLNSPKMEAFCIYFGFTTWILIPASFSGNITWDFVPEDNCTEITGCDDSGSGGGTTVGGGGGSPPVLPGLMQCDWWIVWDVDTLELISVTDLGCHPI